MRTAAKSLVRSHLEDVNSWAGQLFRGSLPAAVAKLRITPHPLLAPHQDWNGFPLSTESGEDVQQERAGEKKLKARSYRMCGRNLSQPQVIDEETETHRGAANREDLSFVRLTLLKLLFWGAGGWSAL